MVHCQFNYHVHEKEGELAQNNQVLSRKNRSRQVQEMKQQFDSQQDDSTSK